MGPTKPSENLFFRGLWGWATDTWERLVSDGSGRLKMIFAGQDANVDVNVAAQDANVDVNVAAQGVDVEVTQVVPADLTPGICGWDGTAWRKLNLLWGFYAQYMENLSNVNCSVGDNFLNGLVVPAGEVWRVSLCAAVNTCSASTYIDIHIYDGSTFCTVYSKKAPAAGEYVVLNAELTLVEGDCLRARVRGATAGDDFYFRVNGYKMRIAW